MVATVSRAPGISLSPSSNLLHDATYLIIFALTSSFAKSVNKSKIESPPSQQQTVMQ